MIEWTTRIEVTRQEKIVGWLSLKPVKTEILPQVGEHVSLLRKVDATAGSEAEQ